MNANDLKDKKAKIETLVVAVQKGDQEAFAKLYDLLIDPVYRYVFYRVKDEDAEDIVETVFIKVWENIRKYKAGKGNFAAWVFRIAHNLVVDHYRAGSERAFEELDANFQDHKREHNPVRMTEKILDQKTLKMALKKLKRQYQDILIYKFIDDLSNEEVADLIGKSEGALRILQHRALKALRQVLEEMGVDYHF